MFLLFVLFVLHELHLFFVGWKGKKALQTISNYDSILCVCLISIFCGFVSWKIFRTNLLLRNSRAAVVVLRYRSQWDPFVCPKNPRFFPLQSYMTWGLGWLGWLGLGDHQFNPTNFPVRERSGFLRESWCFGVFADFWEKSPSRIPGQKSADPWDDLYILPT